MADPIGKPVPYHRGQEIAYDSERRIVALVMGSQAGKTCFIPWWLWREIQRCGGGDYIAATSTYDLFKLKMLPSLLFAFVQILGIGRYWSGLRVIEIADPSNGLFMASRADDPMYARIILRSADSEGGLESATAKAAVLDEAGQDRFDLDAWKAVKRRLALTQGRTLVTTTLYEMSWIDSEIIDKAQAGGSTILETQHGGEIEFTDNPDKDIALIQCDSIVNPLYPHEEYEDAQDTMPNDEFQAFYRGRRVASRLLVYDCFDKDLNQCPRFEIPSGVGRRWLGLDFGPVNTVGFYLWEDTTAVPSMFYLYRIYRGGGRTGKQHAEHMLDGEPGIPECYGGAPGRTEENWRLELKTGGLPVKKPLIADVGLQVSTSYALIKSRRVKFFDDLVDDTKIRKMRFKRDRQGNVTEVIENESTYHAMAAMRYILPNVERPPKPKAKVVSLGG